MAFTLKLKKSKAFNPSTKEYGYRTTTPHNNIEGRRRKKKHVYGHLVVFRQPTEKT